MKLFEFVPAVKIEWTRGQFWINKKISWDIISAKKIKEIQWKWCCEKKEYGAENKETEKCSSLIFRM